MTIFISGIPLLLLFNAGCALASGDPPTVDTVPWADWTGFPASDQYPSSSLDTFTVPQSSSATSSTTSQGSYSPPAGVPPSSTTCIESSTNQSLPTPNTQSTLTLATLPPTYGTPSVPGNLSPSSPSGFFSCSNGTADITSGGTISCRETIYITTSVHLTSTSTISYPPASQSTNVGAGAPPPPGPPVPPISTTNASSCAESTASAGTIGIPGNTGISASGSIPPTGPQSSPPNTPFVSCTTITPSTTLIFSTGAGTNGGNATGANITPSITPSGYGGQPGGASGGGSTIPDPASQSASPPPPPPAPASSSNSSTSTSTLTSITTKTSSVNSTHTTSTGLPAATGGAMSLGQKFDTILAGLVTSGVWALALVI